MWLKLSPNPRASSTKVGGLGRDCTSAFFMDDKSGLIAHDRSRYRRTATATTGTPSWTVNDHGNALVLIGDTMTVTGPAVEAPGAFTVLARIAPNTSSWMGGLDRVLFQVGTNVTSYGIRLDFNRVTASTGNPRFRIQDSATTYTAEITGDPVADGESGCVAAVYDGATLYCYWWSDDGTSSSTSTAHAGTIDAHSTIIFGDDLDGSNGVNLDVNYLMTFAAALSVDEMLHIFDNPYSVLSSRTLPVLYSTAGTTYFQTNTGTITSTGALSTAVTFGSSVSGTITATGAISKTTKKALSGTSTATGAIIKSTKKALSGNITATGAINKITSRLLEGSTTITGALSTVYKTFKTVTGTITSTGALSTFKFTPTTTIKRWIFRVKSRYLGFSPGRYNSRNQ